MIAMKHWKYSYDYNIEINQILALNNPLVDMLFK